MPKLVKPPTRRTFRLRFEADMAQRLAAEGYPETLLADALDRVFRPPTRPRPRDERAAMESVDLRSDSDLDRIRRAFLDLPAKRGRCTASCEAVAAHLGMPLPEIRLYRLRILEFETVRPIAEWPAFVARERREARKRGERIKIRTNHGHVPGDSPGWSAFLSMIDDAEAAGEDGYTAMLRLYEEAPAVCVGCGAPLWPTERERRYGRVFCVGSTRCRDRAFTNSNRRRVADPNS